MEQIYKYPRTHHIADSGLQRGDEDLRIVPFKEFAGRYLVIEEKMDGANSAVSFSEDGQLHLQSRGHYLTGGVREQQFDLFKRWAGRYTGELWEVLGNRYIMYGEWLYAKHTVFYTDLPHYFMEFDVYDTIEGCFLSTLRRSELLAQTPCIVSVKVLHTGLCSSLVEITSLVGASYFIAADHLEQLRRLAIERGLDAERVIQETEQSLLMEGLYIKVEEDGIVQERYKYVRPGFLQTVLDSQSHWMDRPIIPNQLAAGVTLF